MDVSTNSQTDIEVQRKREDEHLRLQRQVRQIQADRLASTDGVHPQFRRQDLLLSTLKKEYINIIRDLKIAKSGTNKKKDQRMKTELQRVLLLRKHFEIQYDDGVCAMNQLDEVTYRSKKQTLHLKKVVNANAGQMNQRRFHSEQRLLSTENRLETATMRFNAVQWENKKVREEIECILKDRMLFNQAWLKMLNALNKGKKFLTDLFESSTLAYDQRDDWCTKLRSVQDKGRIDQMTQMQEMRDLQKAYDHEMKLFKFLAKKGVMRINQKEEEREELEKTTEEENARKECEKYRKILEDITNYTNETEEQTMESFARKEQEIHSIYKLLTDTCAENEVLRRGVLKIRQEIEDRKDWNEMEDTRRESSLERLNEELERIQRVNGVLRRRVQEKVELLNGTMTKIDDMFKMLECSTEPFQNLLGHKQPSLWQLNLTLRLISEKIKEYLQIVYYYERHVQKKLGTSTSRLKKYTVHAEIPRFWTATPINLMVPADPCPSCVEARWLSRVCETPEVPFSKELALSAIAELDADPAFVRSDRVHQLTDCRVPRSRVILATRYLE